MPVSVLDITNELLRGRRIIVLATLLLPLVLVVMALRSAQSYTATAAFMPQARRAATAGLSGIASQLGLAVGADAGNPVPLYADLLQSRAILGAVAAKTYTLRDDGEVLTGPLDKVLRIKAPRPELTREYTIMMLRNAVRVIPDLKTGIIRVSMVSSDPELARAILANMLDELNRFNLETRQSQAKAERMFAERRLQEIRGELATAEQRQEQFLRENREYRNSPQLLIASQRLERDVSLRQQLFVTYAQAYEQAKVDEVRDTPVISVIEPPERSLVPNRRYIIVKGLTGIIVGFVLSALFVLARALARPYMASRSDALAETRMLWSDLLRDLRRPWRLFRRTRSSV
jgi:uncharacterized protein involved in exopolysaccharide biosynthesis